MATIVTLDIFSGRPNPTWTLTDAQEAALNERVTSLTDLTDARPSGVFGGLGYRGFQVVRQAEHGATSERFHVHENIVDRGLGNPNLAATKELETFLLQSAGPAVPAELLQHVSPLISASEISKFLGGLFGRGSCPQCHAADAPVYNPGPWNVPSVQPFNNCYNYANNQMTNTFAQPGRASGHPAASMACNQVQPAATSDGLHAVANFNGTLPAGKGWYVALVVWPGTDYHWYRQDKVGCWSHKPGQTAARNVDNSGHAITDPKTCNRGPYTDFCTYMVTHKGIHIK